MVCALPTSVVYLFNIYVNRRIPNARVHWAGEVQLLRCEDLALVVSECVRALNTAQWCNTIERQFVRKIKWIKDDVQMDADLWSDRISNIEAHD